MREWVTDVLGCRAVHSAPVLARRARAGMGSGAMGTQVGTGTHGEVVMKGKVDDEQSGPDGSGAAKVPAGTASRPAGGAATWVPRKWELIIIVLTVAP